MNKLLTATVLSLMLFFGHSGLSSAASTAADGTYTLFDGDEVQLDNGVWVRPSFSYASTSLVSLVFYTGSITDSSTKAIIGTNFLNVNDTETKELSQGTVRYTVDHVDRSSSNPSIIVSFVSGPASTLKISNIHVKVLNDTFDDGPATAITWDTNFLTTNKVEACEQKNCQNPNIAETVTFNIDSGFERPLYESHLVQHQKLKYDTTYYYKIRGETATKEAIEYPAGPDNWLTFTTGPEPKSSFTPQIGYYQNTVVIEWTTDTPTAAKILYGVGALNQEHVDGTTQKKDHKVQIPLEPNVSYKLKIITYTNGVVRFSNEYQVKLQPQENFNKPSEYIPHEDVVEEAKQESPTTNHDLVARLRGKILLQVEENGEAWYLEPVSQKRYYLKDGQAAYQALRTFGLGITNENLAKIPVALSNIAGPDSDGDSVPDTLEDALLLNKDNPDSDNDGYNDGVELQNGYNPLGSGKLAVDHELQARLRGRILLQVEKNGQAWYVNPDDGRRYFMKDGNAAYQIMRSLSLGITNKDLSTIPSDR